MAYRFALVLIIGCGCIHAAEQSQPMPWDFSAKEPDLKAAMQSAALNSVKQHEEVKPNAPGTHGWALQPQNEEQALLQKAQQALLESRAAVTCAIPLLPAPASSKDFADKAFNQQRTSDDAVMAHPGPIPVCKR